MRDPQLGWPRGEQFSPEEAETRFDLIHQQVGGVGRQALVALSVDIHTFESDRSGWTTADVDSLQNLARIDELLDFMVPPEATSVDSRMRANELIRFLHHALPFGEAERWWLLRDAMRDTQYRSAQPHDEGYLDPVRLAEERIMVGGTFHLVSGRYLLQRFWSWRREVGEYESGEGLNQARKSLAGLIQILAPDLGLPQEYEDMVARSSGGDASS